MQRTLLFVLTIGLAGCSFMVQPHRTLDRHHDQPSVLPIVADTVFATAALAAGIGATVYRSSCDTSQWTCTPDLDNHLAHEAGAAAIVAGAAFAVSALYGHGLYAENPESHAGGLAGQAAIAAHGGDCATAAAVVARVSSIDPHAYERLLDDPVVQACRLRINDQQRQFVLDAIARAPR